MVAVKKTVCVKAAAKQVTSVTLDAMDRGLLGRKGIGAAEARSQSIAKLARKLARYSSEANTDRDLSRARVFDQASQELRKLINDLEAAQRELRVMKSVILKMHYPLRELKIDQATATVQLNDDL